MGLRIAITGPTGMLGSALCTLLSPQHELLRIERATVDGSLVSPRSVDRILALAPDMIVHTAAITDLKLCEQDPHAAHALHTEFPRLLARACHAQGVRLIHVSTDYVYRDAPGTRKEEDAQECPPGVYAATKWAGDVAVRQEDAGALVVRLSPLGRHPDPGRSNFVTWLITELVAGHPVQLFTDQVSSPVFVGKAAREIARLANGPSGALNIGLDSPASRFDIGLAIARAAGIEEALVRPASLREAMRAKPRAYPAPSNTSLDVERWRALGGTPPTLLETANEIVREARLD